MVGAQSDEVGIPTPEGGTHYLRRVLDVSGRNDIGARPDRRAELGERCAHRPPSVKRRLDMPRVSPGTAEGVSYRSAVALLGLGLNEAEVIQLTETLPGNPGNSAAVPTWTLGCPSTGRSRLRGMF